MCAVKAAGVPNMVWFNYRRVPAISLARQLVDEERFSGLAGETTARLVQSNAWYYFSLCDARAAAAKKVPVSIRSGSTSYSQPDSA